jgi:tetratricopeptide (TPR) repeat protein
MRTRTFLLVVVVPALLASSLARAQERQPLSGEWKGQWTNSLGERGDDTLVLRESATGELQGTWSGNLAVSGTRVGPSSFNLGTRTGTRDYRVTGTVEGDVLTLTYVVTRLDAPGSYEGQSRMTRVLSDLERARALLTAGDYRGAAAAYTQIIAVTPNDSRAYEGRGQARNALKDFPGAIQDLNRALVLNPNSAVAFNLRGFARATSGDPKEALEDYSRAIELDPRHVAALRNRGDLRRTSGDDQGAMLDYNQALKLAPKDQASLLGRGFLRFKAGDNAGAVADYNVYIAANSKYYGAYFNRGLARKKLGDLTGALADFQSALALNPTMAAAKTNVATLQASLGQAAAAGAAPAPARIAGAQSAQAGGANMPPPAGSAANPASPKVVAASIPAPATRVLAPFKGYAVTDPCAQAEARPGVPWDPAATPAGGAVGSAKLGQYEAMLRHTMEGLRLLYGRLTPAEEKDFNGFWAPFFNHPTEEAQAYFQQIIPLLDDMTVTLSNLDGMLPGMGEALQGTMIAGGDPSSGAARIAAVQYQRVKDARAHLDDLSRKISALGNPPNPLAAQCAAVQHHRKAVPAKVAPQGEGLGFGYFLNKVQQEDAERTRRTDPVRIRQMNAKDQLASKQVAAVKDLMNSGGANDAAYSALYAGFGARRKALDDLAAAETADVNDLLKSGTADDAAYNELYAGYEPRWQAILDGRPVAATKGPAATPASPTVGAQAGPAAPEAAASALETDPQVNAEAIAQHLALAEQTRQQADRWAADAAREKDNDQCEKMQRTAAAMYANAQSEKDLAESLRTGTMVHTRTDWDEQQHQATVGSIKTELAAFSAENKLLANLPKVADMVTGVEGLQLREQMEKDITDAIHSPDAVKKLAAIYAKVQDKVIDQGQQEIAYAQDRVERWENRIAVAEKVEMAAGMSVTFGALWAPAEVGTLALGYAGLTGFAEGGVKGATVAVVRSVSSRADAIISAYEGATRIDPATGQPGGLWGAVDGALWSIGTNTAMEAIGSRIQKAKADYALAQQAAGGAGFAPMARATGEGRLKEFDFQTPEQRYKAALEAATTPAAQSEVSKKYAIQEKRQAMGAEKDAALQRADDAVRQGTDPAQALADYNKALKDINDKYGDADHETRNQEHQEVMEKLGFDLSYDENNKDIMPTGSKPTTAESDMDFKPVGTPHEAYQKGVAYTQEMKRRGHNIDEYGDRWVDTTSDTTIWKPGFGEDKPGSGSFEAEVIFGTLPNSDKFGTKGGVEWTSLGDTDDPLGAVLANAGKAAGAGLGNSRTPDLHVIGKSASKAVKILGEHEIPIEVDKSLQEKIKDLPRLLAQIKGLRDHNTPEQAGVVDLGADPATRDKQVKSFMDKVQALMGRAIALAKDKSEANAGKDEAAAAGLTPDKAIEVRSKVQAYQSSDKAAMDTIAEASPGLAAEMGRSARPADLALSGAAINVNVGGLTRALAQNRDSDAQAPALPADSSDPAFRDLGRRCILAAQNAAAKLAAAKPGSDEARYLADLKAALEQGGSNPAEAVRTVRGLSGLELPVVLAQLGAPAK